MKHIKFIFIFIFLVSIGVNAQTIRVQGKVIAEDDRQPLIGVSVIVQGTGGGTITDIDGNYTVNVESNAILQFSYIGYVTIEENIGNRSTINVTMTPEVKMYDEIIVMGYSSQKKSELSSAVVTLSANDLTDVTTSDVFNMLQGKVAGVVVFNATGRPGERAEIRIRGTGSINAEAQPLFVVDGVPGGQFNVNDIETLTVLKDAGATAIYGASAAGGVIVVTTKSGSKNQTTQIDMKATGGLKQPLFGNLVFMEAEELWDTHRAMMPPNLFSASRPPILREQNFNWQKEFFSPGWTQNYYVSASGSNDKTRYHASIDYYNEDGTLIYTKYERFSGRLNLNTQLYKNLDLNVRLAYSTSNNRQASSWTTLNDAHLKMPWDNPYDEEGNPVLIGSSIRPDNGETWYSKETWNSLHSEKYNYAKSQNYEFSADVQLNWNITNWLMFTTTNRYNQGTWKWARFIDPRTYDPEYQTGYLNNSQGLGKSFATTELLKAHTTLGSHNVSGLLGWEYGKGTSENNSAEGIGMPLGLDALDACSALRVKGYSIPSAGWSAFGQMQYNYLSKYFVTASLRADASSYFGPKNRVGYFPSGAASWLISNEDFLSQHEIISFLKLRGSYGVTGNSNIPAFQYLTTFKLDALYQDNVGALPERLAYPQLSWESAYMAGAGLDINLWRRIELNLDVYQIDNKDLLLYKPKETSTGFTDAMENVGSVRNRGVEFQLNTINVKTRDFKWDMGANFGLNRNEVTSTPNNEAIQVIKNEVIQELKKGQDIFSWYMPKWLGVNSENGEPQWEKIIYDTNGNITNRVPTSVYGEADFQVVGKATPKFTGGWINTFTYKWVQLYINTNFVYGNKIFNHNRVSTDSDGAQSGFNQLSMENNKLGWSRWENQGDNATHPKLVFLGNKNSNSISSRYLEDGSYFRIRNVTLSFDLKSVLNINAIRKLNLNISGDNLFTFTKFSGMDPEVSLRTTTYSHAGHYSDYYPGSRQFLIGVEIGF